MVHGDRSLIQLEVRIVGVRLIDVVRVLAGNKRGLVTNMHCTIIASPIVDNIRAGAGSSRRAGSRSGRSLDRLGRGIDSTLAGAVGSDRVVDGYIVLFPNGEEIIIRKLLVGRNLRCNVTGSILVGRTGPDEEVSGRAALGLGPALEGIAVAGRSRQDINSLVDCKILILVKERALAFILAAVVAVPINKGIGRLLGVDKLCAELYGVSETGLFFGAAFVFDLLCIFKQNIEGGARIHLLISVFKSRSVPLLDDPTVEDLAFRRGHGTADGRLSLVFVEQVIDRRGPAAVGIISQIDAFRTDDLEAPAGIQLKLVIDPDTVLGRIIVFRRRIGVVRCVIFGRFSAVIGLRDRAVVELERIKAERVAVLVVGGIIVLIPTDQFIIVTRGVDELERFTIAHAERRVLVAHVQRRVLRIGVQEHAILGFDPLGIDVDAVLGHGNVVEDGRRGALVVQIPSFKGIPRRSRGLVILCLALGIIGQLCAVGDGRRRPSAAVLGYILDFFPVAVDIHAVPVGQRVAVAGVIHFNDGNIKIGIYFAIIRVGISIIAEDAAVPCAVPVEYTIIRV